MTEPRHTTDTITSDALDALYAELEAAKQFARSCAKDTEKALKRQRSAKLHADLLQGDLDTLRGGLRELGGDPTQVQNLWAQISLRNRQWRQEKQRAERAEAAIDRVRSLATQWAVLRTYGSAATELRTALNEPQEPASDTVRTTPDTPSCDCPPLQVCDTCQGITPGTPSLDSDPDTTDSDPDSLRDRYAAAIEDCRTLTPTALTDVVLAVRDTLVEELTAELAALKTIGAGYCPHCGRGDCSPSADQWREQQQRAEEAQAAIERVREVAGLWFREGAPGPTREAGRFILRTLNESSPAATELEKTARVYAALHQSAEQDVTRVTALYEQWVKAGPPPIGTPMSRWWDRRLAELHDAILPPTNQPKEPTT
ncbi:hypothetical protein [Streptomyces altiplanensis]